MIINTLEDLFIRKTCLCGQNIVLSSTKFLTFNDDYTYVSCMISNSELNNKIEPVILINLRSSASPYGAADYLIKPDNNLNYNFCGSYSLNSNSTNTTVEDFFKKHLTSIIQDNLKIKLQLRCKNYNSNYINNNCPYSYRLDTKQIYIDLKNRKIDPIELDCERFIFNINHNKYHFDTDFTSKITKISCSVPNPPFIIGKQEIFKLDSVSFIKFEFNKNYLSNKLNTWLLFS
jgi:hypothetical protein